MRIKTVFLATIAALAASGAGSSGSAQDISPRSSDLAAAAPLADRPIPPSDTATTGPAYEVCVRGPWPAAGDAGARSSACRRALSANLNIEQGALVRLTRGIARVTSASSFRAAAQERQAYAEALEDFDAVLTRQPQSVDALIARGHTHGLIGNRGQADADLQRALSLAPESPQALVVRGLIRNRQGDKALAMRDYEAALQGDPSYPQALVNRAALLSEQGRHDEALRNLDRAIAVAPKNPVAHYNRGFAHFATHDYGRALDDYDTAIRLDPEMGVAYNNRCLVRAIVGKDVQAAREDCQTARLLLPHDPAVNETRGFLFLKMGDARSALSEYDRALSGDPNRPLALYGRGIARALLGNATAGERDRMAALSLSPLTADQFTRYGIE